MKNFLLKLSKSLPTSLGKFLQDRLLRKNLSRVPSECLVFRLVTPPKNYATDGSFSAIQFDASFSLSTEDRKNTPIHLSVWVDGFTSYQDAYSLLPKDSPKKLVLKLSVSDIENISIPFEDKAYKDLLSVIWVHLEKESLERFERFRGHAGIVGLDDDCLPKSLTRNQRKLIRKAMRLQLAEIATEYLPELLD